MMGSAPKALVAVICWSGDGTVGIFLVDMVDVAQYNSLSILSGSTHHSHGRVFSSVSLDRGVLALEPRGRL